MEGAPAATQKFMDATTPGADAVAPEEAPQGPVDNRSGGSGDTAADVCGLDGTASIASEISGCDTDVAAHCSNESGGAPLREPGEPDGSSVSYSVASSEAASTECFASTSRSSPSVSAGRASALGVADASGSVGSGEYGGTGDGATGVVASCATQVAAAVGNVETGYAGSADTSKADVRRAAARGNGSAENVAGASCETECGGVETRASENGGTGEAGVSASCPTRVDGTGRGRAETGVAGSATPGNAGIGGVTGDEAAAGGGGTGSARSVAGRTAAARVEPAAVPSSVHYGVYVTNIPLDVEDDQLRVLFEPYGKVLRLKLVRRPEYTSFLFAYVLLDSDDNTKRAIHELDGTVLNGQPLKVESTFGRTTHIFGIGEGTPYNRSRAELEQWRQNRDAQQRNGNRDRQSRNDYQWRRGYNDRSNYGDRRFGDRDYRDHRYGDRFNNDRRVGGANRFDNGNRSSGGNDRHGGYRHNYNNQGRHNNRYDNDGCRSFARFQRNGFQGDCGGGHWQHGYRTSGGRNQGGCRSSDDGQRHQYGRYQDRYGGDFSGRRGGGGNDGGYGHDGYRHGGNRGGDDDGYANSYERCQEARRKMRDAWTRRLERLAAEGDDGEERPTFDELLELVRHAPYNLPVRADDIDDENEEYAEQPVFWWSRDSIAGGGGDCFGPEQAPRSVPELLRWRHGEEAVTHAFSNADGEESEEDGGVCLIVDGGADSERRPRSLPHEDCLSAIPEQRDSGGQDIVGATVDDASGDGDEEGGKHDEEARLTQGDWMVSVKQHVGEERQPRADDGSENKLAEGKKAGEESASCEEGSIEHSAATSSHDSVAGDGDVSENTSVGPFSTVGSSGDISVNFGDVSANDNSEGPAEDDTLQSQFASGRSLSPPGHFSRFTKNAEGNDAGGQSQGQQPLPQADDGRKDADTAEKPSRSTSITNDGAGKGRGSSMDTKDVTEEAFENAISEAASAGPTSNGLADAEEHHLVVVPEAKSGNSEKNLSVAAKLQCSVEATQNESLRSHDCRRERRVGISATTSIADRMAAASSWNRAQRAAAVKAGAEDYENETEEDGSDYYTSDEESFCTAIIVRMKNARNAVHLAARPSAAATESKSVQETEKQDLPREPPAAKVISELMMSKESGDVPSQTVAMDFFGLEIGQSSESIAVREAPAQTDLRYKEEAPIAGGEKASNADEPEGGVSDEMRALVLDETECGGRAANMAAAGFGRGAKPKGTRVFQRAKRRQRQNVAESVARWVPPDQTFRPVPAVDGGDGSGAPARRKEDQREAGAVDDGVQDVRARECGARRALRRKRDFEDDSVTDDELSDSEVDDRMPRASRWVGVGEYNAPDASEVDRRAESAAGDVEDGMLSVGGGCAEVAATKMQEGFPIENSAEDDGGSKGTGGPTGREPKCGGDVVLEANGRRGPGEDDPEAEPAMTSDGFEEGAQDGVGGAQQTTAAEQGAAQSSCAGGDSSETARRDAVDTRRPSRASRRGEEIECEPSDDGQL
ncbi:filaggrin-2-like isoform X2 [Dermacentor albipictus]|uniref:filaggrin-2-like isoform X2 n=1 Tax=Dermacentor albipictus TaxID=60249 RepID=UPI0038FCE4FD